MVPLSLADLNRHADAFDADVRASALIDHFCSSTDWILPAAEALMPNREPFLRRGEAGWVALMRGNASAEMRYLEPLEAMWGLACPLISTNAALFAREAQAALDDEVPFEVLVLCGLAERSELFSEVAVRLDRRRELRIGPRTGRIVASLAGGLDGFLSRRSANFRKALKQAKKRVAEAGIVFEPYVPNGAPGEAALLYDRIVAIEHKSWKGREGTGIVDAPMNGFYRSMVRRLLARGTLRLLIGTRGGDDVAFVLGALASGTFRGLQASFDDDFADVSLGTAAHHEQIRLLCEEGVRAYDLGTDVPYKRRWGEPGLETVTLIALPRM